MQTVLVLDAAKQALYDRELDSRFVVHADRRAQHIARSNTERLAEAGTAPSPGSVGDAYDNALAKSVIGLFKTEVIRRRGTCRGFDDVEFETLVLVAWFSQQQRILAPSAIFGRRSSRNNSVSRSLRPPRWLLELPTKTTSSNTGVIQRS